jgi:hypothetical protein
MIELFNRGVECIHIDVDYFSLIGHSQIALQMLPMARLSDLEGFGAHLDRAGKVCTAR